VLDRRPFQANASTGQVGALQRELAKQRRGLHVRKLLETYGDLITQLMPCVLVSPDSVARFFPVGSQTFDLVVFDEASQIRVADAVGAMGRGRSVIVVGDSKQMPPTSFAELSLGGETGDGADTGDRHWTEDEAAEALPAEDEESILSECVQARVPQRWLSWHYRSQDESLIAFSNRQYYAGGLSSFPAPRSGLPDPGPNGHAINLVRVDGQFHRSGSGKLLRTNPIEAQAVVDEIRRRFLAEPGATPSIGVVTFNVQQRTLIEALLRDTGDERLIQALDGPTETGAAAEGAADHEGLFVKNLENVQGDERDVIMFSTAFSVNSRGSLPLNFGPLNRSGGERRLNVAITRARRQVVVFSSFDPRQLRAEETSSVGIKHLRAYLDLAERGPSALAPSPGEN
jgi:superfamily I DNA and/or RNA helicase